MLPNVSHSLNSSQTVPILHLSAPRFLSDSSSQVPAKTKTSSLKDSTATIGFEAKLWLAADKLRNNMDAAEYKHVVLGLIFLKYISDTFEEHRAKLLAGEGEYAGANAEDPDQCKAENVYWVPAYGRWFFLQASAMQPSAFGLWRNAKSSKFASIIAMGSKNGRVNRMCRLA